MAQPMKRKPGVPTFGETRCVEWSSLTGETSDMYAQPGKRHCHISGENNPNFGPNFLPSHEESFLAGTDSLFNHTSSFAHPFVSGDDLTAYEPIGYLALPTQLFDTSTSPPFQHLNMLDPNLEQYRPSEDSIVFGDMTREAVDFASWPAAVENVPGQLQADRLQVNFNYTHTWSPEMNDLSSSIQFNYPYDISQAISQELGHESATLSFSSGEEPTLSMGNTFQENDPLESLYCEPTSLGVRQEISADGSTELQANIVSQFPSLKAPYREIRPSIALKIQSASPKEAPFPLKHDRLVHHHQFVPEYQIDGDDMLEKGRHHKPARTHRLSIEERKQTAAVRKKGACSRCVFKKIKCDGDDPCLRCKKLIEDPTMNYLCDRTKMPNLSYLIFGALEILGLEESVVESLLERQVAKHYPEHEMKAYLTCGPTYDDIEVTICEFDLKSEEFLKLTYLGKQEGKQTLEFAYAYSLPYSIPPGAIQDLRKSISNHIESVACGPRNPDELKAQETSSVSWELLKAINLYQKSTEDKIIKDAMGLYQLCYIINHNLELTKESADLGMLKLYRPTKLNFTPTLACKVINQQVKQIVLELAKEKLQMIFTMLGSLLDKKIDRKTTEKAETDETAKANWAICFILISILCMSIEMCQVRIDAKFMYLMTHEQADSKQSRKESIRLCEILEEPVNRCKKSFHKSFQSHKFCSEQTSGRGLNPIRDGVKNNKDPDDPFVKFVRTVTEILAQYKLEMQDQVKESYFDCGTGIIDNHLANHNVFRKRILGSRVSKFLLSFEAMC